MCVFIYMRMCVHALLYCMYEGTMNILLFIGSYMLIQKPLSMIVGCSPSLDHAVISSCRPLCAQELVWLFQPCLVLFHGDYLPTGRYWNTLVNLIPNILHVNRSIPTSIFGHEIKVIEHSTDVARLEVMKSECNCSDRVFATVQFGVCRLSRLNSM